MWQRSPAGRTMDLREWSAKANELTGTTNFSAGLDDSWIKRYSVKLDQALRTTGVPQATGEFFGGIGSMFGVPEAGRTMGEGLPRLALETAGLIPMMVGGPVAAPVGAALFGLGTLSGMSKTYTETGSPAAALVGGVTQVAVPTLGGKAGGYLAGKFITRKMSSEAMRKAIELPAEILGVASAFELGGQVQSKIAIGEFYNPFSAENLFHQVAGQLVFSPYALLGRRLQMKRTGKPVVSWGETMRQEMYAKAAAKAQADALAADTAMRDAAITAQNSAVRDLPPTFVRGTALPPRGKGQTTRPVETVSNLATLPPPSIYSRSQSLFGVPLDAWPPLSPEVRAKEAMPPFAYRSTASALLGEDPIQGVAMSRDLLSLTAEVMGLPVPPQGVMPEPILPHWMPEERKAAAIRTIQKAAELMDQPGADAATVHSIASYINALCKYFDIPLRISDESISTVLEAHTKTRSLPEATAQAAQALKNRLTDVVAVANAEMTAAQIEPVAPTTAAPATATTAQAPPGQGAPATATPAGAPTAAAVKPTTVAPPTKKGPKDTGPTQVSGMGTATVEVTPPAAPTPAPPSTPPPVVTATRQPGGMISLKGGPTMEELKAQGNVPTTNVPWEVRPASVIQELWWRHTHGEAPPPMWLGYIPGWLAKPETPRETFGTSAKAPLPEAPEGGKIIWSKSVAKAIDAFHVLGQSPEGRELENFIGTNIVTAIKDAERVPEYSAYMDLISDQLWVRAMNWLGKQQSSRQLDIRKLMTDPVYQKSKMRHIRSYLAMSVGKILVDIHKPKYARKDFAAKQEKSIEEMQETTEGGTIEFASGVGETAMERAAAVAEGMFVEIERPTFVKDLSSFGVNAWDNETTELWQRRKHVARTLMKYADVGWEEFKAAYDAVMSAPAAEQLGKALMPAATQEALARLRFMIGDYGNADFVLGPNNKAGYNMAFSDATLKMFDWKPELGEKVKEFCKVAAARRAYDFERIWVPVVKEILQGRLGPDRVDMMASLTGRRSLSLFFSPTKGQLPEGSLPAAAAHFITQEFLERGFVPQRAKEWGEIAGRVVLAFRNLGNTSLAELRAKTSEGTMWGFAVGRKKYNILGVNIAEALNEKLPREAQSFMALLTAGHEAVHIAIKEALEGAKGSNDPNSLLRMQQVERLQAMERNTTPEDMIHFLNAMKQALVPDEVARRIAPEWDRIVQNVTVDREEFLPNALSMIVLGMVSPSKVNIKSVSDFLLYGDKPMTDFARGLYADLHSMLEVVRDVAVMAGADGKATRDMVDMLRSGTEELLKTREEIEAATIDLQGLMQFQPAEFLNLAAEGLGQPLYVVEKGPFSGWRSYLQRRLRGYKEEDLEADFIKGALFGRRSEVMQEHLGVHLPWFEKWLSIPAHLREMYPQLKDLCELVYNFRGKAENTRTRAMAPLAELDNLGRPDFKKDSPLGKVLASEEAQDAYSELKLEQTDQKRRLEDADLQKLARWKRLPPDLQEAVKKLNYQMLDVMKNVLGIYKDFAQGKIGYLLAVVPMTTDKTFAKESLSLGSRLTQGMLGMKSADPQQQAMGQALVAQVQGTVSPAAFTKMTDIFNGMYNDYKKSVDRWQEQSEYYSPERRQGKVFLKWFDSSGEKHFEGFWTEAEATSRIDALGAKAHGVKVYSAENRQILTGHLYPDIMLTAARNEKKIIDRTIDILAEQQSDEGKKVLEDFRKIYVPLDEQIRATTARGMGSWLQERKKVAGRETINMLHGELAYIEGMAMGMAKARTRHEGAVLLNDPNMVKNPELQELSRKYLVSVVDPPAKELSKMKALFFHYFLGANLSSVVIERFQPVFSMIPQLIRNGNGFAESYRLLWDGMKGNFELYRGKDPFPPEWKVQDAVKQAQANQIIGLGAWQELEMLETEVALTNMRRIVEGGAWKDPMQLVKTPVMWYDKTVRGMYRAATAANDRIAFIAGYIEAKKKGLSNADAFSAGQRLKEATMFSGGDAARPMGLFSNLGQTRGVVGALYSLRHYSLSMLGMYYMYMKESIGKDRFIPPEQKANARKAMAYMVGMQMVAAGALGLPLAGSAVAILEQIDPELELKKGIREAFKSVMGDDEEWGGFFADAAIKGLVSAATPIDVSARFGLGDMFGLDPNQGFTAGSVFGASGSMAERMVRGTQDVFRGETTEAFREYLPNAIGNLVKLIADDRKLRDRQGNLIYEPDQAELIATAVGFKPKKLSYYREQQAMVRRTDEISKNELVKFHQSLADLLLKQQPQLVREALMKRAMTDETYDPRVGLDAVVNAAQQRIYPINLMKGGISAAARGREQIAQLYPERPAPKEIQLLAERKQMEQTVGIPGAGRISPTELRRAQYVDYLMQVYPQWTLQHARMVAARLMGGSASQNISRRAPTLHPLAFLQNPSEQGAPPP